eukprot:6199071-Pleurochrysis_carterae.AAC.1
MRRARSTIRSPASADACRRDGWPLERAHALQRSSYTPLRVVGCGDHARGRRSAFRRASALFAHLLLYNAEAVRARARSHAHTRARSHSRQRA